MAKHVGEIHFKVLIEQDEAGWYVASVPELQGCATQGKTLEEVRIRIKEAIELVLETDKELADEKLFTANKAPGFFGIDDVIITYA